MGTPYFFLCIRDRKGFQEVCGFVANLVDAGIKVYGTGSYLISADYLNTLSHYDVWVLGPNNISDDFLKLASPR